MMNIAPIVSAATTSTHYCYHHFAMGYQSVLSSLATYERVLARLLLLLLHSIALPEGAEHF